ncbi:MAG: S-methyl-5-thioribose-1-phosphate isomerase [Candidatus Riflebacteria bacterium]|nr:S-methyl-5-thioribose-1-phosphate isomerase [Candidatus Riflebacteria bacterium]
MIDTVYYKHDTGRLELIDQTLLPVETRIIECRTEHEIAFAIKTLQVRGAPAIGVAAAYGVAIGLANSENQNEALDVSLDKICKLLISVRPTAVNLAWAVKRVQKAIFKANPQDSFEKAEKIAIKEADQIKKEDIEMCRNIGKFGAELIKDGDSWLTHCNAGALATAGYGTALGVFRAAKEMGKNFKVYVDETRPLLQGARLTAWELMQEKIDSVLICDNMAGSLIRADKVQGIVVGADRITSKGFVANKIGTYSLAVLAKYNGVPFYVAAPTSTFDLSLSYDDEIVIEERDPDEVRYIKGVQIAPADMPVYNPAFDITPPELITGIITNKGIIRPIYGESIPEIIKS